MAQPRVLEGTWEEIKLHEAELAGRRFRLVPVPPVTDIAPPKASDSEQVDLGTTRIIRRELIGMGKFAGIIPSSDEFIRQKQEEIELEDRILGP